ncbi:MAG: anhydro-N-acetylmuramic acid kinase [Rhodospirillales bacterium]
MMAANGVLTALGLMSGTSLDGIDAALLQTDGETIAGTGPFLTFPYDDPFRDRLRAILGSDPAGSADAGPVAGELTERHVEAVKRLLDESGLKPADIDVIGFHGHTVTHQPDQGITRQIGDGARLALETGIRVVNDFRAADVAGGGQGAPLAPLYHAARSVKLVKPLAVLNIGGVANLTWISPDGGLVAFDTGPGNALIDDWVKDKEGQTMDLDGNLAHAGKVDSGALEALLDNPYFMRPFPKSLDRNAFDSGPVARLSTADGAATLTAFTAAAVEKASHILPAPPNWWLVCGGGRLNPALMAALRSRLTGAPVEPVEMAGWKGDALEAQAFGFLAVRSIKGLPLSLPSTTGVGKPMTGGVLHHPDGS